jgi:Helix-turn-helix domain
MPRKYKRRAGPRFVQLHHDLLRSNAWHMLATHERCGYIELAQLYDGSNNGRLAMSARRLAELMPCNKDTASKILRSLEDAGLIEAVKIGHYAKKEEERMASEYRLTHFRCDATHELPSKRYNPRHRWQPSEPAPKRAAPLTDAERQRRRRSKRQRHECHDDRPTKPDGSVRPNRTVPVTGVEIAADVGEKRAKKREAGSADVTLNVRPNKTLIHLTMGGPRNSAPTVTTSKPAQRSGAKNRGLYVVPKKPPLAPGHSTCRYPSVPSLPPGWHWCRFERCVVTDVGVKVPIVDDPTVGTDAQRAALRVFREWEAVKAERKVAA